MPVPEQRGDARRARTDARLAQVITEHLDTHGYAGLTIERVAADSGVAKTTIYRRWTSKAEMVFDVAIHRADDTGFEDSGDLATDIGALAERAVTLIAGEPGRRVLPGLLADMSGDTDLTARLQETFVADARRDVAAVFERAVERGDLPTGVDVDGFYTALLGIPYASVHLLGEHDAERLTQTLTRQLLTLLSALAG